MMACTQWKLKLTCAFIALSTMLLTATEAGAQQPPVPVGTFSGTLSSRQFGSFPVSVTILQDAHGKLGGTAIVGSRCIHDAVLKVTVSGWSITLAGSDKAGNNITFRGGIDTTGTQLTLSYIVNGSASGRCETDDGSGIVRKQ